MAQFITLLRNFFVALFNEFAEHPVQIGDYSVSILSLIFAFLAICMVVSVFWKGARA